MEIEDLVKLSYRELQKMCSEKDLKATGKKEELINRLLSDPESPKETSVQKTPSSQRQTFAGRIKSKEGGWKFSRN